MKDEILLPNYKTVYLTDIKDEITSISSDIYVSYIAPKGLLKLIDILDKKFPEYEFCQIVLDPNVSSVKYYGFDYVLLKLK